MGLSGQSGRESNPETSWCQRKARPSTIRPVPVSQEPGGRKEGRCLELELEADLEASPEIALGDDLERAAAIRGGRLVTVDSQVITMQQVMEVEEHLRLQLTHDERLDGVQVDEQDRRVALIVPPGRVEAPLVRCRVDAIRHEAVEKPHLLVIEVVEVREEAD